jgi:hypothetical protein
MRRVALALLLAAYALACNAKNEPPRPKFADQYKVISTAATGRKKPKPLAPD